MCVCICECMCQWGSKTRRKKWDIERERESSKKIELCHSSVKMLLVHKAIRWRYGALLTLMQ